jgi:hypothetical protein
MSSGTTPRLSRITDLLVGITCSFRHIEATYSMPGRQPALTRRAAPACPARWQAGGAKGATDTLDSGAGRRPQRTAGPRPASDKSPRNGTFRPPDSSAALRIRRHLRRRKGSRERRRRRRCPGKSRLPPGTSQGTNSRGTHLLPADLRCGTDGIPAESCRATLQHRIRAFAFQYASKKTLYEN